MTIEATDQMNRTIRLEGMPRRIVSLVPSQTELLYDLGLRDEVVGITKFCLYPDEWFKSKNRVGGTKQVKIEKVKDLQPDLIIGNKEENTPEDIAALEKIAPVWMSDIYTYEDAIEMVKRMNLLR
jgi:ABC-type Fe3+-hydroxamate transport system substrate-binding protein